MQNVNLTKGNLKVNTGVDKVWSVYQTPPTEAFYVSLDDFIRIYSQFRIIRTKFESQIWSNSNFMIKVDRI